MTMDVDERKAGPRQGVLGDDEGLAGLVLLEGQLLSQHLGKPPERGHRGDGKENTR